MKTKHLLPSILKKLSLLDTPFIIENVRSKEIDKIISETPFNVHVYQHGRHTYWTNIPFNPKGIEQKYDFKYGGKRAATRPLGESSQGGSNVQKVFDYWIEVLLKSKYIGENNVI